MSAGRNDEMKKNDLLTLTANNLDVDQAGVCSHDGMVVFVPGLLPGETAPVKILKVEKRYAFGRLEEAPLSPSSTRRASDCPSFPRCGGCTGRHMTYESTLEAKRRQVEDCFQRIGGISVSVPMPLGMAHPFAYRNKTSLPVGGTQETPFLGFFAPRSHAVIPVTQCPNAMPPSDQIASSFLDWVREHRLEPYQEKTQKGLLRHLVIRTNRHGESMVTVVGNAASLPCSSALIQALLPLKVVSLYYNDNRNMTNVILSDSFHLLYGRKTLQDELCGLVFELSPASFFQINPLQTEKLYAEALSMADLKGTETVCDVYCGVGTITLMLAKHCHQVLGIEVVPAAVENARKNAVLNKIDNVNFLCGAAEKILPRLVENEMKPDVIVVDPPRKGLDPAVIQAISHASPSRLVYISCNAATLARDAGQFSQLGYIVRQVQPIDMFAWTSGIETAVLMTR